MTGALSEKYFGRSFFLKILNLLSDLPLSESMFPDCADTVSDRSENRVMTMLLEMSILFNNWFKLWTFLQILYSKDSAMHPGQSISDRLL